MFISLCQMVDYDTEYEDAVWSKSIKSRCITVTWIGVYYYLIVERSIVELFARIDS